MSTPSQIKIGNEEFKVTKVVCEVKQQPLNPIKDKIREFLTVLSKNPRYEVTFTKNYNLEDGINKLYKYVTSDIEMCYYNIPTIDGDCDKFLFIVRNGGLELEILRSK